MNKFEFLVYSPIGPEEVRDLYRLMGKSENVSSIDRVCSAIHRYNSLEGYKLNLIQFSKEFDNEESYKKIKLLKGIGNKTIDTVREIHSLVKEFIGSHPEIWVEIYPLMESKYQEEHNKISNDLKVLRDKLEVASVTLNVYNNRYKSAVEHINGLKEKSDRERTEIIEILKSVGADNCNCFLEYLKVTTNLENVLSKTFTAELDETYSKLKSVVVRNGDVKSQKKLEIVEQIIPSICAIKNVLRSIFSKISKTDNVGVSEVNKVVRYINSEFGSLDKLNSKLKDIEEN